jgi:hypothetical protein
MKRISFFIIMLSIVSTIMAQKKVDSYYNSYFKTEYDISITEDKNGSLQIYIGVAAKHKSDNAQINIDESNLNDFILFLKNVRDKYAEWSKIAKDNNVEKMAKSFDIVSPRLTICWYGTKWYFSFDQKLEPDFMILDNGKHLAVAYNKVTASSNEYIDQTTYLAFESVDDINSLIGKLDINKFRSLMKKENDKRDLFK